MTTPGAMKRRIDGNWQLEGSYILAVPTYADLPPEPTDDSGIFAWVLETNTLYVAIDGIWNVYGMLLTDLFDVDTETTPPEDGQALVWDESLSMWVPGASVSEPVTLLSDRAWNTVAQTGLANGWNKVVFNTQSGTGFNLTTDRWTCPASGQYRCWGGMSVSLSAASVRHIASMWVNGAERSRGTDYVAGISASLGGGGYVNDILTLSAGDYVELYCYVNPAGTSSIAAAAGTYPYLAIQEISSTATQGPVGPDGAHPPANAGLFVPLWAYSDYSNTGQGTRVGLLTKCQLAQPINATSHEVVSAATGAGSSIAFYTVLANGDPGDLITSATLESVSIGQHTTVLPVLVPAGPVWVGYANFSSSGTTNIRQVTTLNPVHPFDALTGANQLTNAWVRTSHTAWANPWTAAGWVKTTVAAFPKIYVRGA